MDNQLTRDIIRAALGSQQTDFAQQTAERWLKAQPGHLTMSVLLAEALLVGGDRLEARRILREVLEVDPENMSALAAAVRHHELEGNNEMAWASAAALKQVSPDDVAVRSKLTRMATRSPAGKGGSWEEEVDFLSLIPSLAELERQWRAGEAEVAREMAEQLLAANPRLVKAHLILADCLMTLADDEDLRRRLGENAAKTVQGFTIDRFVDEIVSVYDNLLARTELL